MGAAREGVSGGARGVFGAFSPTAGATGGRGLYTAGRACGKRDGNDAAWAVSRQAAGRSRAPGAAARERRQGTNAARIGRRTEERNGVALVNERARILGNAEAGPNLYLMTLEAPRIAARIEPGQFVHMKVPGMEAHVLRRPFSVYARDAQAGTLEVLYQAVGFGTAHMAGLARDGASDAGAAAEAVELIGPVGRGWDPAGATRALLVGGGVGAAPLFMLCERLVGSGVRADVVLGAQTASALACRGRYEALLSAGASCGCEGPHCATDDGSFGRAGFCTSLVEEALAAAAGQGAPYGDVAVCGPEPLMKIVAGMAACADVRCEVSLERRMACGIGACLSCVVDTAHGKRRACVDGPVFDAAEVVW